MPGPTGLGRGKNQTWDLYSLQALNKIFDAITGGGLTPGGLATEATLNSVLNAIIASDQDIEILLVRDTGNSDKIVQQIVNYETGTPVITYKDVDGADYTPVGPLEYLDPSAVMNLMLTELVGINADQATATGQTGMLAELVTMVTRLTSLDGKDYATQTTLADVKTAVEALNDVVWQAGKAIPTAIGTFTEPTLLGINPVATGTVKVILFNDGTTETDLEVWEILNTTIVIKELISVTGTLEYVKLYQK